MFDTDFACYWVRVGRPSTGSTAVVSSPRRLRPEHWRELVFRFCPGWEILEFTERHPWLDELDQAGNPQADCPFCFGACYRNTQQTTWRAVCEGFFQAVRHSASF